MSITIKQAFEKLAMVTGAAVKNPWFVGRNLNQAFADIAANIETGGGGGSTVEVTQVLESGTKIATITVDNTPTDLYAPSGSSGYNYSTTEHVVGKWIDDSDVYENTILIEAAFPYNQWTETTISFTGIEKILYSEGCSFSGNGTVPVSCSISAGNKLQVMNMRDVSYGDTLKFYLTVRYIKSSL